MLSEYESRALLRAISKSLAVMGVEERAEKSPRVLKPLFQLHDFKQLHNLTRTRCLLLDQWMQHWLELQGHVSRLRVELLFGLLGAEAKHLKQWKRLTVNISRSQDARFRLEPNENKD